MAGKTLFRTVAIGYVREERDGLKDKRDLTASEQSVGSTDGKLLRGDLKGRRILAKLTEQDSSYRPAKDLLKGIGEELDQRSRFRGTLTLRRIVAETGEGWQKTTQVKVRGT